jgi:diguanylate cyclase (GGDEF)-like protein
MPGYLRMAVGPVLAIVLAGALLVLARAGIRVPSPGFFMLGVIVIAAYVGGIVAGYLTAAIGIGLGLALTHGLAGLVPLPSPRPLRSALVVGLALVLPAVVGHLRKRAARLLEAERTMREKAEAANRELMMLRSALDNVDHGVLLLDDELRARFMNRAFRKMWKIPDSFAEPCPALADLIRIASDAGCYTMPASETDDYLAWRLERLRAGDESPFNLRLPDGTIIRSQCKVLPGGGRFLSYTDVTDLVRHAEQLERLATLDELTGLYNRRRFLALADAEHARHAEGRLPLALVVLDIDLFKSVNDRFGHHVGDAVIRHVGQVCRMEMREHDIIARIGGEEFVMLLPETTDEQALAVGERLRRRVEASPLRLDDREVAVTISIGVAVTCAGTESIGTLMKSADDALYRAKRDGRNRVTAARRVEPAAAA